MEDTMKAKKIFRQGIAALLSLSLITGSALIPATQADAAKKKIKLNKTKLTLKVGATYTLKLKNNKAKVKWSTSKKKIATVSAKGKVKAKKAGSTVITATAKGKKYKCKVTVKKKTGTTSKATPTAKTKTTTTTKSPTQTGKPPVTPPTPMPTPITPGENTPDPTDTEDPTEAPDNPTPTPTKEPLELDPLAKNITLKSELLANHLLITATNTNQTWVDEVIINYSYFDYEMNEIASGNRTLFSMKPGEVQYISIELSETFAAIDENASEVYPDVLEADESTEYMDLRSEVAITADPINTQSQTIPLNLVNHSRYDVGVSYAVLFYDENGTKLMDAYTSTLEMDAKETTNEIIDLPVDENAEEPAILSTNYKIVYTARAAELIDETTPYIGNIKLTPQKTTYTLLVNVTNSNKERWLKSLDLEYQFYDADDHFITSETASLQSMKPGETQTVPFNLNPDTIGEIDFNYSYAEINLEPDDGEYEYNTTTLVSAAVVEDKEENDFEITLKSLSSKNTEGSFLIKFYADSSKKVLIGAEQRPYTLLPNGEWITNVSGAVIKNENNLLVYPAAYDITVQSAHTLVSK